MTYNVFSGKLNPPQSSPFNGHFFQVNLGQPVSSHVLSSTCSGKEPLGTSGKAFYGADDVPATQPDSSIGEPAERKQWLFHEESSCGWRKYEARSRVRVIALYSFATLTLKLPVVTLTGLDA